MRAEVSRRICEFRHITRAAPMRFEALSEERVRVISLPLRTAAGGSAIRRVVSGGLYRGTVYPEIGEYLKMSLVSNFKELAIGVILLIVLASFVAIGLASANITGLARTVLTFLIPIAGISLLFAAFKNKL